MAHYCSDRGSVGRTVLAIHNAHMMWSRLKPMSLRCHFHASMSHGHVIFMTDNGVYKGVGCFGRHSISPRAIFCACLAHATTLSTKRATGGYVQSTSGTASFTMYSGCGTPACGISATGFTAAMNQLSFGSAPGLGAGDGCGRCFSITGNHDPFSPAFTGPFGKTIVVKVTDLCPVQGNEEWCGQTTSQLKNQHGEPFHFDICEDTGGAAQFFPSGHGALTGIFTEVSCSQWAGSDGSPQFTGACLASPSAAFFPTVACGNKGTAPS
ncbi:RlpA-like double-psi beta-barrel-protein domain-containing protein-containing protein [Cytidiella melzeri]|nr:RlpA-like double-psi beta-barrel-protein domain-containing protein-containing protein [Cytidiella melzeri]